MTLPFISVVIPTYNRPQSLAACLAALGRSTYPRDRFEVIVSDDGSHTPVDLADRASGDMDVRLVRQVNGGPARARNLGAGEARGDLIAFTDDDCTPDAEWLTRLGEAHQRHPHDTLGGATVNALPGNPYSSASQLLIDFLYAWYNRDLGRATFFTTNNLAAPTAVFRALGGFDGGFPRAAGEDREFCDRLIHEKRAMRYVPEAMVGHAHAMNLRRFWTQHQNYGRAAFHFHGLRAARAQEPVRIEPPAFYFGLLTFPLRHAAFPASLYLTALIVLAQFANAFGFFRQKAKDARASAEAGAGAAQAGPAPAPRLD